MVWNRSVRYNEREVITWALCEGAVSNCVPLVRLLRCVWVRGWVEILGQGGGGDRAMDRVCRTRDYCIHSIAFVTFFNDRKCDELNPQRKT